MKHMIWTMRGEDTDGDRWRAGLGSSHLLGPSSFAGAQVYFAPWELPSVMAG